ncbi:MULTISPECIES: HD domain-containing protein [unclassified Aureimonas]|uniref:HD domain-containing protein n=1 Tax=unclassified Aureimonas TaxID=2615206 RepID=UPI00072083B4|nr:MULTISPECIES: HD domain-containing protein [unclassified Aureimonas]ALN72790.1 hypothetical protein M673_08680 [Aureimonas sp. AU20]
MPTSPLEKAEAIASVAHEGQLDKRGRPFLAHLRRVAGCVCGEDERIVALLHDVVEKGPGWTLSALAAKGFSPEIVAAVDALTRREGESDQAFVARAVALPLARSVKRADLKDNLESARQFMSGPEAEERIARYEAELRELDAAIQAAA